MREDDLHLKSERLKAALQYWQSKRRGRLMPSRRDIDPVEIPKLLPYLLLMDVLYDPLDFRFRLVGTAVRDIWARDYTGMRLSELPGKGPGSVVWDNFRQTVLLRRPLARVPPYVGPNPYLRPSENLLLPLSADGEVVNMILLVVDVERVEEFD